jgi:hypothetical protein
MTWVPRETKDRFAHLAHEQGYFESAFLKRLVDGSLAASGGTARQLPERVEPTAASGLLSIRLRSDDLLLLRERAAGRDMPTSTYASLLIRAHLRTLGPASHGGAGRVEALRRGDRRHWPKPEPNRSSGE